MKKLPSKIDHSTVFDLELEIMKESLERSGIVLETNSKEEILEKLNERNVKENLCEPNRPPFPCDYVDIPKTKWLGHGFFYKSGKGSTEMHKDNAWEDFDAFDNFCRLTKCKVLLADYESIRVDFNLENLKDEEIDEFLIDQFCFVSTGQIKRMKEGGDLFELVDADWVNCVDEKDTKIGIRQRGGGRANTFFVNNEYEWDEDKKGRINARMVDVKGSGTTLMQPNIERKASGFLSYADALKGFVYEMGIRHALKNTGEENPSWKTVHNYAIIDIGIRWKDINPSTGIGGDTRNVYMVRAPHSRFCGSPDDPVYYSVVTMPTLENEQGQRLISSVRKLGISSEQIPFSEKPVSWNVQCTASYDTLVDFSHWYFMPTDDKDAILKGFRMTEETFKIALKMQGVYVYDHPGKYDNTEAMKYAYGTDNKEEAKEIFEKEKEGLMKIAEGIGEVGKGKPKLSWSWHCEMDDSLAFKTLLEVSCSDDDSKKLTMGMIKEWLK